MTTSAVFPGSFDPFSIAHLAIVDAAHAQLGLERVVCTISVDPLGKNRNSQAPVPTRTATIDLLGDERPWLEAAVTRDRHLADIAAGFDWLIVGADKWEQLHDVAFYDDASAMQASLSSLPAIAYVPRDDPDPAPPVGVTVLQVDPAMAVVSSTAIRAGRDDWRALQPADVAGGPEDDERSSDHRIDGNRPEHP